MNTLRSRMLQVLVPLVLLALGIEACSSATDSHEDPSLDASSDEGQDDIGSPSIDTGSLTDRDTGSASKDTGSPSAPDSGTPAKDAGSPSASDSGTPAKDAGSPSASDSGTPAKDAGTPAASDSGTPAKDAGTPSSDAGTTVTWNTASLTEFTSYPDPNSEECIEYNGCLWEGMFAALDEKQTESWVQAHNIAAVHSKDFSKYKLKTLRLRKSSREIDVVVYDMCADSDCDGCCTQNAKPSGFLIDIEKYTAERFGVAADGQVEWRCIDCD